MDKREYLVSIGLARPGRGRFSAEAESAWQTYQQSGVAIEVTVTPSEPVNPDSGYVDVELPFEEDRKPDVAYLPTLPTETVRKETLAYSITKEGYMVAHTECGTCHNSIAKCACQDGPDALGWVRKEVEQKPYLVEA